MQNEGLLSLYLYNFLLFVDWPCGTSAPAENITIGVLEGLDAPPLFKHLHGKQIKGKTLIVQNVTRVSEIDRDWNVLFIRRSNRSLTPDAVCRLKSSHCLTISNMAGFTELGGMVEFVCPHRDGSSQAALEEGRSPKRFRIHLDAVLEAGLRIRSRLLRLSDVLGNVPDGKAPQP